jgi:methylglyoxal synthase
MMKKGWDLALFADQSRIEELTSLMKAHAEEFIAWKIFCNNEISKELHSATGIDIISFGSNYRHWSEHVVELMASDSIKAVIYLDDQTHLLAANITLLKLMQMGLDQDIPVAINMASAEAIIHLLDEYPEALTGHHLAAQYLEEIAYQH